MKHKIKELSNNELDMVVAYCLSKNCTMKMGGIYDLNLGRKYSPSTNNDDFYEILGYGVDISSTDSLWFAAMGDVLVQHPDCRVATAQCFAIHTLKTDEVEFPDSYINL